METTVCGQDILCHPLVLIWLLIILPVSLHPGLKGHRVTPVFSVWLHISYALLCHVGHVCLISVPAL